MGLKDKILKLKSDKSLSTPVIPTVEIQENKHKKNGLLSRASEIKSKMILKEVKATQNEIKNVVTEQDLFADWEKDALEESMKMVIQNIPEKVHLDSETSNQITKENYVPDIQVATNKSDIADYSRKIENYLALYETTKEIINTKNLEDFYSNVMYEIQGQIGAESMLVFGRTETHFEVVQFDSVEVQEEWIITNGTLLETLNENKKVLTNKEIEYEKIFEIERDILEKANIQLILPIFYEETLQVILMIGATVSGSDYTEEDLEFLRLLSDIAGVHFCTLKELLDKQKEYENRINSPNIDEGLIPFAEKLSNIRTIEEVIELLSEFLLTHIGIQKNTFILCNYAKLDEYFVYDSNLLSKETISKFKLSIINSYLINMVSNVSGVYEIANYIRNTEINSLIPEEELRIMKEFTVVPLVSLKWLVGLIVVHEINEWTDEKKELILKLCSMVAPVIANIIMLKQKEVFTRSPYTPIEEMIEREIKLANQEESKFSLLIIKVQNISRIINLFGNDFYVKYSHEVWNVLQESLDTNDFLTRIGQGKYAIILKGKDRNSAEVFIQRLKENASKIENPSSNFKITNQVYLTCYPDQTNDKHKLLEMIDET